jgi:hypothetical protein
MLVGILREKAAKRLSRITKSATLLRPPQFLFALASFGSSGHALGFLFGGSSHPLCANSCGMRGDPIRIAIPSEHREPRGFLNLFQINPFGMRICAISARNSFRIRTYESLDLKSFRMRTYEKRSRGSRGPRSFQPVSGALRRALSYLE